MDSFKIFIHLFYGIEEKIKNEDMSLKSVAI
jgi:hypothetical protein